MSERSQPAIAGEAHTTAWGLALIGSAAFVLVAVALEFLGGSYANSPVGDWTRFVPLAWPTWGRVLWWAAVATAAGVFRLSLHRIGISQRPLVVVATVAPFAIFSLGIATGESWATWH